MVEELLQSDAFQALFAIAISTTLGWILRTFGGVNKTVQKLKDRIDHLESELKDEKKLRAEQEIRHGETVTKVIKNYEDKLSLERAEHKGRVEQFETQIQAMHKQQHDASVEVNTKINDLTRHNEHLKNSVQQQAEFIADTLEKKFKPLEDSLQKAQLTALHWQKKYTRLFQFCKEQNLIIPDHVLGTQPLHE